MTTVSASELASRARANSQVRIDTRLAQSFLEEWRDRGIACEVLPGRWALTPSGAAMFAGWAGVPGDDQASVLMSGAGS